MTIDSRTHTNPPPPYVEPTAYGYLYLGFRADPPRRIPLVPRSSRRRQVLRRCQEVTRRLRAMDQVVSARAYRAVAIQPSPVSPRFDVIVLIETTTPDTVAAVQITPEVQQLGADFVMPARNIRRLGDIDRSPSGTFLFNHFTADDPDRALRYFDSVAGWFSRDAKVDDIALLGPLEDAPYVFINQVRLPGTLAAFILALLGPNFRNSVYRKMRANRVGFASIICKPV
ncbi:hypothetical protein F3087_33020 [Nocardia colli]|uniref:Uncharacterized protein n=1 Tax=Nocardia colli TaxID=2545717 RepID=A0A5N0E8N0_9NOCA|nr:hypothetical protein [Nocardia colli]KAA8884789.1 hypothetical protein F3087_33020 [Nocardia colli]